MLPQCRVLIVDDHPVVRRGLRAMLEGEQWVEEVAEAATVDDAVREAVSRKVHVVAMDINLPDGDGIEATRRIVSRCPGAHVLIVTLYDDQDRVARALRAGARGYVVKDTEPETILDALRTVAQGGVVLGPKVGPEVLTTLQGAQAQLPPPFDKLTAQERRILTGLVRGESNAEIGRSLGLNEKTVRNYLTGVFDKLGVDGRVQAALRARDAGIEG
ncbi:response regulator transcription factor [Phytohabitans kaempferiae]|uniref:Response regulator n=1 Tax=Phytohabitans kaempferiae TaxID=1620943 RepID=A0ABV6MGL0_9ACTN